MIQRGTYSSHYLSHRESCIEDDLSLDVRHLLIESTATTLLQVYFDIVLVKFQVPSLLIVFFPLFSVFKEE